MIITGKQIRAARGYLDWTRVELAKFSGVSPETIKNIEKGVFVPRDETLLKIEEAFNLMDLWFVGDVGLYSCN